MKKTFIFVLLTVTGLINAQAFKGKGDTKFDIAANIQNGGSGIRLSSDFGLGENISVGVLSSYLLSVSKDDLGNKPDFGDRIDLKARFNANLGNVFNIDEKVDIYPGLDLGLRNFGAHLGIRYFFTDGFGVVSEIGVPIAKYKPEATGFERLNNQFTFNIGASFNL
ncbi:hypothetical protein SAMN05443543_102219 [Flavobacterium flevense]|uniref:OmpA family outer membrane protein n=1 Tax=Flavobacterium flevense TaxID=983 RepID=A0A4Y4ATN8_9FLAO|nr:DUF6646 family protein [Flavobacterium flevense]GEC71598.1 OmpA family outer membrane protein [Flavobacterium flevense]SHL49033.1 hypothetical protein SAMN05443543_102219 [Flavobacterium flevense]